jgi:hypothetical protein
MVSALLQATPLLTLFCKGCAAVMMCLKDSNVWTTSIQAAGNSPSAATAAAGSGVQLSSVVQAPGADDRVINTL